MANGLDLLINYPTWILSKRLAAGLGFPRKVTEYYRGGSAFLFSGIFTLFVEDHVNGKLAGKRDELQQQDEEKELIREEMVESFYRRMYPQAYQPELSEPTRGAGEEPQLSPEELVRLKGTLAGCRVDKEEYEEAVSFARRYAPGVGAKPYGYHIARSSYASLSRADDEIEFVRKKTLSNTIPAGGGNRSGNGEEHQQCVGEEHQQSSSRSTSQILAEAAAKGYRALPSGEDVTRFWTQHTMAAYASGLAGGFFVASWVETFITKIHMESDRVNIKKENFAYVEEMGIKPTAKDLKLVAVKPRFSALDTGVVSNLRNSFASYSESGNQNNVWVRTKATDFAHNQMGATQLAGATPGAIGSGGTGGSSESGPQEKNGAPSAAGKERTRRLFKKEVVPPRAVFFFTTQNNLHADRGVYALMNDALRRGVGERERRWTIENSPVMLRRAVLPAHALEPPPPSSVASTGKTGVAGRGPPVSTSTVRAGAAALPTEAAAAVRATVLEDVSAEFLAETVKQEWSSAVRNYQKAKETGKDFEQRLADAKEAGDRGTVKSRLRREIRPIYKKALYATLSEKWPPYGTTMVMLREASYTVSLFFMLSHFERTFIDMFPKPNCYLPVTQMVREVWYGMADSDIRRLSHNAPMPRQVTGHHATADNVEVIARASEIARHGSEAGGGEASSSSSSGRNLSEDGDGGVPPRGGSEAVSTMTGHLPAIASLKSGDHVDPVVPSTTPTTSLSRLPAALRYQSLSREEVLQNCRYNFLKECFVVLCSSGIFTAFSTGPMVVASQQQAYSTPFWETTKKIYRYEGVRGFFKGILPRWVSLTGSIIVVSNVFNFFDDEEAAEDD